MREFIYYSERGVTTGNLIGEDLMKAGRIDIACQFIIQALFVSKHIRDDVKVHLVLNGPPDAPKHLEIFPGNHIDGVEGKIDISKKDVAGLIKRMLYKYKKGERIEVSSGYHIEKKSMVNLLEQLSQEGKEIYILDKKGTDIRDIKIPDNPVFIVGDQEGISKQELKRVKHLDIKKISVGPQMLFASQVITLIHNEIDRKVIKTAQE